MARTAAVGARLTVSQGTTNDDVHVAGKAMQTSIGPRQLTRIEAGHRLRGTPTLIGRRRRCSGAIRLTRRSRQVALSAEQRDGGAALWG